MSYTQEELQNLSRLLLSVDESSVELAFELIRQGKVTRDLVSNRFDLCAQFIFNRLEIHSEVFL